MNTTARILAQGLRFPEGPVALPDGSVLVVEIAAGHLTRIEPSGRHEVVAHLGGEPNGAALGPDGRCYICNNGGFSWVEDAYGLRPTGPAADYAGGAIQRVDLASGAVETLYDRGPNGKLCGPNDIVFDGAGGFWFTDFGKTRARSIDRGGVYYARCDGSDIREVIYLMACPDGIGLSPDGTRLYVSETDTGRIWAFDVNSPGRVARRPPPAPYGAELVIGLPGYQRLDSLALEAGGNICAATLSERPGITIVSPTGHYVDHVPTPDPLTTNICFGGPGLRTAYVTLSGSGRLAVMDWPRAGLALHV